MANLQYVGPRVVPKAYKNPDTGDAEWKSGIAYEGLMLVTYNGNGYISAVPVPPSVGNPADNPDYWVKSADFNAALSDLQNRVSDLENEIGTGTLPHSENTIIDALNYLDNPYEYIVWIGDSYTGASSLPDADRHNRYSTRVSAMLGLTEKNYAVGGNGFINGTHPYSDQLQDAIDDFTTNNLDPTKVKYFIIGGSRNDQIISYADSGDYVAAVRAVITGALQYFTKARVIIIPLLWDAAVLPKEYLEDLYYLHYACTMYVNNQDRVQIIDNAFEFMTGYYNDILYQGGVNVHWNSTGHWRVARKVYNAILGTPYAEESYKEISFTSVSSKVSDFKVSVSKVNHKVNIDISFEVGANSINPGSTLANVTLNNLNFMPELYFGGYNIRGWLHTWSGDSYPVLVQQSVTKTGDTTGTCFMEVNNVGSVALPANTKLSGFIELDVGVASYNTAVGP